MHTLVHQCAGRVEKNRPELVYMSGTCKRCTGHVGRWQNMLEGGGVRLSGSGRVGGSQYASVRVEGGRSVSGRGWRTWRTRGTCWGARACGMNIQEEAGEAVGASRCIQGVLEVVGQRWASRDASGSVGSAWGCVRRQGGLDGSGARRVGRVGVLRHVVSGHRGGRQGGCVRGGWRHVEDAWVASTGRGTSAAR